MSVLFEVLFFSAVLTCSYLVLPLMRISEIVLSLGLLFITLTLLKPFVKAKKAQNLMESVILTLGVLALISKTGEINSPFFFLTYFLLFALSLLVRPVLALTAGITLMSVFALGSNIQQLNQYIVLFSLPLIAPFGYLLGEKYRQSYQLKQGLLKDQLDIFLFLSLVVKKHVRNMGALLNSYSGDQDREKMRNQLLKLQKLVDQYEKEINK